MALNYPDILQHNNPNLAIADSNFIRGGTRTAVANLTALYALSSKVDQLKQYATRVYVTSEAKYYVLVDIANVAIAAGWVVENGGGGGSYVPYTGATANVDLGAYELTATKLIKYLGISTQFLKADGSVDENTYLTSANLPSTLELFATTSPDPLISGYTALVRNISDSRFNTVAVDVTTPVVNGTIALPTFCGAVISDNNIISGNPGVFNFTLAGNIRKTAGPTASQAEFFFRIYKRSSAGTETLISESAKVLVPNNSGAYILFSTIALWNNGTFLDTDRIVLKFYGILAGSGTGGTYQFQFGGTSPVRGSAAVPTAVIPNIYLKDLADVEKVPALNNEILYWNNTASLWEHALVTEILGYTPIGGSGSANFISRFNGTGTTITNSSIYESSTKIGIGNSASGTEKLQVTGIIKTNSSTDTVGGGYKLDYGSNAGSRSWKIVNDYSVFGTLSLQVSTDRTGSTYSNVMNMNSSGNVGIGGTPLRKLDVFGDIHLSEILRIDIDKNINFADVAFIGYVSTTNLLDIHSPNALNLRSDNAALSIDLDGIISLSSYAGEVFINSGTTTYINADSTGYGVGTIEFQINNTPYMMVHSSGDVSIGTTGDNGYALEVAGSTKLGGNTTVNVSSGILKTVAGVITQAVAGTDYMTPISGLISGTGTRTTSYIPKFSATDTITNSLLYDTGFGINIGTTALAQLLTLNTATGSTAIGLYTSNISPSSRNWAIASNVTSYGDFAIRRSTTLGGNPITAGGSIIYIPPNSDYVGIGVVPARKLDVGGDIHLSGTLYVDVDKNIEFGSSGEGYIRYDTPTTALLIHGNTRLKLENGAGSYFEIEPIDNIITIKSINSEVYITSATSSYINVDSEVLGNGELQIQVGGTTMVLLDNDGILRTAFDVVVGRNTISTGYVQAGISTDTASSSNVGAIRYRADANNSYMDMVMKTGASTWAWVNIVQNNW